MVAGGVFIALGSNQGDREGHVRGALSDLGERGDIRVLRVSSLIETAPVGGPPGQPDYLNAVAELATTLRPRALLDRLLAIERRHGRRRSVPNAARPLDLDLLLYGEETLDTPGLTLPHPRMWQRDFVMRPLAELCPAGRLAALRERARAAR